MKLMITGLAGLICAVAAASAGGQARMTDERVQEESASGENWFLKGGNFRGEHYSPLGQVDDDNVGDLGLAWAADIDIPDGIATTPIVVDGVIYIGGAYSIVYAVDAATGKVLWRHDPEVLIDRQPAERFLAGAREPRYCRLGRQGVPDDGRLQADRARCGASGRPVWSKQTCDTKSYYSISDSPYVGGGKVFVGNAGSESPMKNRGYVSAYDTASGDLYGAFTSCQVTTRQRTTRPR